MTITFSITTDPNRNSEMSRSSYEDMLRDIIGSQPAGINLKHWTMDVDLDMENATQEAVNRFKNAFLAVLACNPVERSTSEE